MSYKSTITPNVATVLFDDGTTKCVHSTSKRFKLLVAALRSKASEEEILALADGVCYIRAWSCGEFQIKKNKVTWKARPDYPIPRVLCDKLLAFAEEGYPADAFVKFLKKLLMNPSNRSIETFFGFIENQGLTIDADGDVIGYKGVSMALKDMHTGTVDNRPGQRPKMDRNLVDDDPANECSTGSNWCPLAA